MRALAEFIMRGRVQAIAVAAISVSTLLFTWLGAAAVGLVTLRRGAKDGVTVLGWAMLPALAIALFGFDIGPAMALIGTAIAANSLRKTQSWPLALIVAVVTGLISALVLQTVASGYVEQLAGKFNALFDELNRSSKQTGTQFAPVTVPQISGLLGFGTVCSAVAALLLARWWQAMLYNPGGFRSEFHQLRLPVGIAALLVMVGIGLNGVGPEYRFWSLMCTVPFFIAGFALIHGVIGLRGWGRAALVVAYIVWLLIDWAKAALLLLTLIDSFVNFRARIKPRASN